MSKSLPLVLGFHPSSRGFSYVLLEDEHSLADWSSVEAKGDKNKVSLARFKVLLDKYRPSAVAMEDFDDRSSQRSPRIRRLYRSVMVLAEKRKITVGLYSRAQLGDALGISGKITRDAVAATVADHLPVLKRRLPKHRRAWDSEQSGMALFCAAACALCYCLLSP